MAHERVHATQFLIICEGITRGLSKGKKRGDWLGDGVPGGRWLRIRGCSLQAVHVQRYSGTQYRRHSCDGWVDSTSLFVTQQMGTDAHK